MSSDPVLQEGVQEGVQEGSRVAGDLVRCGIA
eukprot:COSAG01_NODE_6458_length_3659_cov_8.235526_3_plen_32_part_00